MDGRIYSNAPITEAIIDLRVNPRDGLSIDILESVRLGEEIRYPESKSLLIAKGQIEIGSRLSASATQESTGFSFVSYDQKQVFQSRFDGFTFSRLAPYDSWGPFSDEARRLWKIYHEKVIPKAVTRLAVRYINRFDLPSKHVEMKEYFRTSPEVSPDLHQVMNGFFMRVAIPQEDIHCQLLINQTIVPSDNPDVVSVVLDIDLFREVDVPQEEGAVWNIFEILRSRKDQVFEACITDRTRDLIR